MAKYVGTWIYGDTIKPLVYTVKNVDGTARDLTAAVVTLEGRSHNDVSLQINVGGTVDPDQVGAGKGKVTFTDLTNGLSIDRRKTFECRVHVDQAGLDGWCGPFDIVVEVWP